MRITDYRVIASRALPSLLDRVHTCISEGMVPHGDLGSHLLADGLQWVQPMVKVEEQHDELVRLRGVEARAKMMLAELGSARGVISDAELVEYAVEQMQLVIGGDA